MAFSVNIGLETVRNPIRFVEPAKVSELEGKILSQWNEISQPIYYTAVSGDHFKIRTIVPLKQDLSQKMDTTTQFYITEQGYQIPGRAAQISFSQFVKQFDNPQINATPLVSYTNCAALIEVNPQVQDVQEKGDAAESQCLIS